MGERTRRPRPLSVSELHLVPEVGVPGGPGVAVGTGVEPANASDAGGEDVRRDLPIERQLSYVILEDDAHDLDLEGRALGLRHGHPQLLDERVGRGAAVAAV